jgi:HEAT repeat protein
MKRITLLVTLLAINSAAAQERSSAWNLTPPAEDAKPVKTDSRLDGIYPAGSRIKDDKAPGGFGPCDNYPLDLGKRTWGAKDTITLIAFPEEPAAYLKHQGIALRLANRTGKTAAFEACDSCLYIVQEALDDKGRWREIEEPPCAICGNSFHRVFLKSDQFWEFKARRYDGPIKTKIRFRLDPTGEKDHSKPIYSNEFAGQVAKSQFRMTPTAAEARRAFRSRDAKEEGVLTTLIGLLDEEARWGAIRRVGSPQREAALHLAEFGPTAKEALPALRTLMKGKSLSLRASAAYSLWKVDGQIDEPVKVLIAVLSTADENRSQWEAALWLSEIGPSAKDAVPALCKALKKAEKDTRSKAVEALTAIRAQADIAVPALIAALKDDEWLVRSYAAHALQAYGADAKQAIPALREALRDKNGHVRYSAAEALWTMEHDAGAVVPTLVDTLKLDDSPYARSGTADVLGKIGPAAKQAIPQLTASLKDEWRTVRVSAAGSLWKITQQSEPALGALIQALKESDSLAESDTGHAIALLEEMGQHARAALPALRAALKKSQDQEAWARERVEKAIRKIDSGGK